MIKGCQKKIIHLKNTGSPYFEEAYFILKDDSTIPCENDMVKEALRIAEASTSKGKVSANVLTKLIPALIGAALSSFIFGIILLFVTL